MKIPKICNWYKIKTVTYKIRKTSEFAQSSLDFYIGVDEPIVCIVEYQIQYRYFFCWRYVYNSNIIRNFKTHDAALNYIIEHNRGRVVNLIRE